MRTFTFFIGRDATGIATVIVDVIRDDGSRYTAGTLDFEPNHGELFRLVLRTAQLAKQKMNDLPTMEIK